MIDVYLGWLFLVEVISAQPSRLFRITVRRSRWPSRIQTVDVLAAVLRCSFYYPIAKRKMSLENNYTISIKCILLDTTVSPPVCFYCQSDVLKPFDRDDRFILGTEIEKVVTSHMVAKCCWFLSAWVGLLFANLAVIHTGWPCSSILGSSWLVSNWQKVFGKTVDPRDVSKKCGGKFSFCVRFLEETN